MLVSDVMTSEPVTCREDDVLETVLDLMNSGGFRRVPVVGNEGELIGIVTESDLREHVLTFVVRAIHLAPVSCIDLHALPPSTWACRPIALKLTRL